jgi:hypothetical protein
VRKFRMLATLGVVVATTLLLAAPAQADHEEKPTPRDLLEKCNNGTDSCVFHPSGQPETFLKAQHAVGDPVFNCTGRDQQVSVAWSETNTTTDSLGLDLTLNYGAAFKQGIRITYGHEWKDSHTEEQSTWVTVRPGEVGQVFRGARMQRARGTYELHFGSPYYGHYYWYQDFTAEGPVENQKDTAVASTRKMTEQERSANCG